eukprot:GHVL01036679.1.p1 GENE.GHVL01036679.1~~GHVL01036679.1.p1  ORF type:complete len:134 (+),score=31.33 GHVL01036679.1:109-510(+)
MLIKKHNEFVGVREVNVSAMFLDEEIIFHIIQMKGCYYIWIGTNENIMDDLHVAFPTKYDPYPTVSTIFGYVDQQGYDICKYISKILNCPIYLSCGLPIYDPKYIYHFSTKMIISIILNKDTKWSCRDRVIIA